MVTMKGYTSSLTLLLLLIPSPGSTQSTPPPGGDTTNKDYLPPEPWQLLLPVTAGTFKPPTDLTKFNTFGQFKGFSRCGKVQVTGKTLDLPIDETNGLTLECYPHPMRVLYVKDPSKLGQITSGAVDFGTCQGIQLCNTKASISNVNHGGTTKTLEPANSIDTLKMNDNLCPGRNTNNILLTNELGCSNPTEIPDLKTAAGPDVYSVPRWDTNDDGLFEIIRSFTLEGIGKKSDVFHRTNSFITLPKQDTWTTDHEWKPCTAACNMGHIVKMNMKKGGGWKTTIYLKPKTKAFKVCIDAQGHDSDSVAPKCKPKFELFILPLNGLVIWPKNGRASVIELRSPGLTTEHYAIEFGFGYGKKDNGVLPSEFYVANMFREVVVSDSDGYKMDEAARISFFFEESDDLAPFGIYSAQIEAGKTYIEKTKADQVKDEKVLSAKDGEKVAEGKESLASPQDDPPKALVATTTPSSKRLASNAAAGVLLQQSDNSSDAIYMPGKWWAWGLYIGFIIGSIVGVAIIGGIFYVLRRTVYGFWYRGMYKRYGCDASGTTGGITGVGFGNTTTGAITVGGTTGGGTTVGRTGGTTGGTTSGTTGGTTGSMTSTGGASTIAM
ncbi:hypothetical protein CRE_02975 [Caenorhabditis remanei]|uniref:Uncharacterized protein n=1 Tax=Caenorhabditis remanei TaxID=31234 RepID=E3LX04_CAERE|nr:hypothetical protein CRE_02975 [Caenorhabditis remanei]